MSRLLKLVAEKDRRFEDDFEIERTEDGDEEIVGKRYDASGAYQNLVRSKM